MREFSLKEVLEYSRDIEQESYKFYREAASHIKKDELKNLLEDLAEEELGHFNRFNNLLDNTKLTEDEMNSKIQIKQSDLDMMISTKLIPAEATALEILEIARQREINTGNIYRTLLSITNLSDNVIDTFTDLMNQEKGHATRISRLMDAYK